MGAPTGLVGNFIAGRGGACSSRFDGKVTFVGCATTVICIKPSVAALAKRGFCLFANKNICVRSRRIPTRDLRGV